MRALVVERHDERIVTVLSDRPEPSGEVLVDVECSGVNYKDGLAMAGRPGVIRAYPLVPGIDLAGTVRTSEHPGFAPGDRVV
ncbi:MAG: alcohol dehydrogenase catalytic domain-containing protein, partial [Microbacteriaceae bacterium]